MILNICDVPDVLKVIRIVEIVITIIKIIVPIILIVSIMIDLLKSITNGELNKKAKTIIYKIIAAILIFLIPTFVNLIASLTSFNEDYSCLFGVTNEMINEAIIKQQDTQKENNIIHDNQSNNVKLNNQSGEFQKIFTSSKGVNMKYWVFIPENATENMPLIIYLHGGSGKYNILNNTEIAQVVKRHYGNNYPFILLVPYKDKRDWYAMGNGGGYYILAELINQIMSEYKTNSKKTILTGCSDGGLATWQFAADYPDMFSAIVPVSGAGYHYVDTRLKVFENSKIRGVVSSDGYDGNFKLCMTNYCDEIESYGGYCKLEEIKGLKHETIVTGDTINGEFIEGAYSKEMFDWMLSQ